ncbi:lipoprotein [Streptomyces bottropensis ATCC 25435]|uniref:Lipoprotein n=2 Tax=Streptomyces bottropensis TaxID=42235 RepID=M3F8S6_9ACTN|nr:lipoprotein [Streptomyces bottropensis ATCC 25435]
MTLRDQVPALRNLSSLKAMRDHPHGETGPAGPHPEVWTGRATNRGQWLLALGGAACMALGIELAVDSAWTSGTAPLVMAVVGCIAAGLLVLFGTLAFVHVSVKVDDECLEVRCGHIGVPRRRIPLSQVADADFAACVTPHQWGGWGYRWRPEKGTAVVVRRGEAVVLRLWDGHTFTITVDNAETAVRVIRARLSPKASGTAR